MIVVLDLARKYSYRLIFGTWLRRLPGRLDNLCRAVAPPHFRCLNNEISWRAGTREFRFVHESRHDTSAESSCDIDNHITFICYLHHVTMSITCHMTWGQFSGRVCGIDRCRLLAYFICWMNQLDNVRKGHDPEIHPKRSSTGKSERNLV